jgi:hypothetical protein
MKRPPTPAKVATRLCLVILLYALAMGAALVIFAR